MKTTKHPVGSPVSCLSSSKTVWSISGWFLEDKAWRSSWIWSFCALPFFLWTKGSKMASNFSNENTKQTKHTHTQFHQNFNISLYVLVVSKGTIRNSHPNGRCFIISKERKGVSTTPKFNGWLSGSILNFRGVNVLKQILVVFLFNPSEKNMCQHWNHFAKKGVNIKKISETNTYRYGIFTYTFTIKKNRKFICRCLSTIYPMDPVALKITVTSKWLLPIPGPLVMPMQQSLHAPRTARNMERSHPNKDPWDEFVYLAT